MHHKKDIMQNIAVMARYRVLARFSCILLFCVSTRVTSSLIRFGLVVYFSTDVTPQQSGQ